MGRDLYAYVESDLLERIGPVRLQLQVELQVALQFELQVCQLNFNLYTHVTYERFGSVLACTHT